MLIYYLSLLDTQEEKDLLETVYHQYRARMKGIALGMMRNEEDAEDAVQQAFLRLIKSINRLKDPFSKEAEGFIVIVLKNACRDLLRKKATHTTFALDEIRDQKYAEKTDMLEGLTAEHIKKQIDELPEIYRDTLTLKVYYQLSDKEIADVLDISAAGVRKRLERARTLLRAKLQKER